MPSLKPSCRYRLNAAGLLLTVDILLVGCLLLGCLLVGCNRDKTPATYPVRGKVLYKSSKQPLTQGTVLFKSLTEPKVQASGDIKTDGGFELASDLGKPGTVAGEHQVMIQPPLLEAGQKPIVQKKFTSYATSGLKATVQPNSKNEVVLEVE